MNRLMATAQVGEWYQPLGGNASFEVVAVDTDSESVSIQHFDGAVEELDFDTWLQMDLMPAAAPEDCSGALDMEHEDFDIDSSLGENEFMGSPLDDIDRYDSGVSFFE